jgi:hypothetical protein
MVIDNLSWLASTIPNSIGICFVDAGQWSDNVADFVLWTDASGKHGLAFVFAGNGFAYQLQPSSQGAPVVDIFFLKLLAILSSIHHVVNLAKPPHHLLLFTDSLDSVDVFNSL